MLVSVDQLMLDFEEVAELALAQHPTDLSAAHALCLRYEGCYEDYECFGIFQLGDNLDGLNRDEREARAIEYAENEQFQGRVVFIEHDGTLFAFDPVEKS